VAIREIAIDTNVILSALRSRLGASFILLSNVGVETSFNTHISVPLALEYEEILKRESRALGLTFRDIEELIDYLCSVSDLHDVYYLWRPFLPDPEDDMLLEVALVANCDTIVTHNIRHFVGTEELGLRAITPGVFLQEIGLLS
jgi:putative PIN family toxin of toxin-antitoxin system